MKTNLSLKGEAVTLRIRRFPNWGICPVLEQNGCPYAKIGVFVEPLPEGEFAVDVFLEKIGLMKELMATGLFRDTGRRLVSGFNVYPVWVFSEQGKERVGL